MILKRWTEARVHVRVELAHYHAVNFSCSGCGLGLKSKWPAHGCRIRFVAAQGAGNRCPELSRFLRGVKLNDGLVTKSENSLYRQATTLAVTISARNKAALDLKIAA